MPVIAPGVDPSPTSHLPAWSHLAKSILSHAIATAASTRQNIAMPKVTKIAFRCFIITATARSTLPVGPCSASRWP